MSIAEKLTAKPVKNGEIPLRPALARRMRAHDAEVTQANVEKAESQNAETDGRPTPASSAL